MRRKSEAEKAAARVERYAEALTLIDEGYGPDWGPELAAAIRAGENASEYARRTGRSKSRVYDALNDPLGEKARERKGTYTCGRCGEEIEHDGSKVTPVHCIDCAKIVWNEKAKRRVIRAIRRWVELYGEPPTAREWNPPTWKNHSEEHRAIAEERWNSWGWPHVSGVQGLFGSWNAAIEAAGFCPLKSGHRRYPEQWHRARHGDRNGQKVKRANGDKMTPDDAAATTVESG